jgi:SAM-dependent methyltransferase
VTDAASDATSGAADPWASHVEPFVDGHYGSVRGQVRTHVLHEHLRAHLPPPPATVVDVGGGAGNQSIPLARAGYEVTIVDPSASMLARARERLAEEDAAVAARVTLVLAPGEDAPGALGGRRYEGVLCHGVVMYLDDPVPLVDALGALAAPGGIVSIVAKNVEALAVRPALAGDWAAALAAFEGERQVNGLGVDTRADHVDALSELLAARGVDPVAWYGVRLFTDGWTPDRPAPATTATPWIGAVGATPPSELALILAVELEASRRDPYRRLSRLFHLVARRRL